MEEKNQTLNTENHANTFPDWKDLLAVVGVFLGMNLLASFLVGAASGGQMTGFVTFLIYTLTFGVTIAFALQLARVRGNSFRGRLHISFKGFNPAIILLGVILMLAANVVIEPLINLFPPEWYDLVGDQLMNGGWAMFTAIVMAPICEEMLFRGIIQGGLTRKRGPWAGVLIASALFGIIHGIPQQVVAGFCLGIIIGFVYYKTGSLLAVIVLHAINNSLAVFTTLFETDGGLQEQTLRDMIGADRLYWAFYAFCVLLLLVSLAGVMVTIRRNRRREIPAGPEKSAVADNNPADAALDN